MSWKLIDDDTPKNRPIIFGGRWKPFDILPGGEWHQVIVQWSTFSSNPHTAQYSWIAGSSTLSGPAKLDSYHIDFTHWHELPDEIDVV